MEVRVYPSERARQDGTGYDVAACQVISDGPPGRNGTRWARTLGQPARWLLLRPALHPIRDRSEEYDAVEGDDGTPRT